MFERPIQTSDSTLTQTIALLPEEGTFPGRYLAGNLNVILLVPKDASVSAISKVTTVIL